MPSFNFGKKIGTILKSQDFLDVKAITNFQSTNVCLVINKHQDRLKLDKHKSRNICEVESGTIEWKSCCTAV